MAPLRLCSRHQVQMVIRRINRWKFYACPVEGCDYVRAYKWQFTPKRGFSLAPAAKKA